jgi:hypothetical protein
MRIRSKFKAARVALLHPVPMGLQTVPCTVHFCYCFSAIGWRLGLQAVTGVVFLTFILGTFYRSASLYHPQRRAILHLKNQKRKIKDKNKVDDRPPFFDFSTLRSKTVRILLVSTGISSFGINTPIFYLVSYLFSYYRPSAIIVLQKNCVYCEDKNFRSMCKDPQQ